jgi:DNA polymerase III epsilon subunit-like protein
MLEFFHDLIKGEVADSYSLHHLTKKYGIKNAAAHTAAEDTVATTELFLKQVEKIKKLYAKSS